MRQSYITKEVYKKRYIMKFYLQILIMLIREKFTDGIDGHICVVGKITHVDTMLILQMMKK